MQAVVLAAGRGRRLSPLTSDIPKCMVSVHGERLIDLVLGPEVLSDVLAHPAPDVAVLGRYQEWMDGTVVETGPAGEVVAFRSAPVPTGTQTTLFKTVNVYKFSKAFLCDTYAPLLATYGDPSQHDCYHEQVLAEITRRGGRELRTLVLDGQAWCEIDDAVDLARAEDIFSGRGLAPQPPDQQPPASSRGPSATHPGKGRTPAGGG